MMSPLLDKNQPSRILVENNTGITIPAITAVKFDGNGTLSPQVTLANPSTDPVLGITNSPILPGASGIVTTLGYILDVDTTAWTEKTMLYSDSSGVISDTFSIIGEAPVAVVFKQGTLGTLFVVALSTQYGSAGSGNENNFSYTAVAANKTLLIPADQQMAVFGDINLDGALDIDGQLIVED